MADGIVQVAPDSTGKKVDTSEVIVSGNTVERQRMVLANDAVETGSFARITSGSLVGTEPAQVVVISPNSSTHPVTLGPATNFAGFMGVSGSGGMATIMSASQAPTDLDAALTVALSTNGGAQLSGKGQSLVDIFASVTPYERLRTTPEPSELFSDLFDGTVLDTTVRWTTAGTAMTISSGSLNASTGVTTANARASLTSKPTFLGNGLAFQEFAALVKFESGGTPITNTHRFIGWGTEPAGLTANGTGATAPVTDGVGFEIDIAQNLKCSIWAAGVETSTTINGSRALLFDGAFHRIKILKRGDRKYFFIDDFNVPVATVTNATTTVQQLGILVHTLNHSSVPGSIPSMSVAYLGLGESSGTTMTIADPTYAFRTAGIGGGSSALSVLSGPNNGAKTQILLSCNRVTGVVAETMLNLGRSVNGAALTTAIPSVSASVGKTLRVTGATLSLRNSSAAANSGEVTLRIASTGAVGVASPPVAYLSAFVTPATLGSAQSVTVVFPEAIELSGSMAIGASQFMQAVTAQVSLALTATEY